MADGDPMRFNDPSDEDLQRDRLREELGRQAARNEATRLLREQQHPFKAPSAISFADLAKKPLPEIQWTVDGLFGYGHNVLLTGAFKVGKSSLILNLIKSLVDGRPFLDLFPTTLDGNVCYMNYELMDQNLQTEIRRMHFRRGSRVITLGLREYPGSNPLLTERSRAWFVGFLREYEVEVLVVDTFRAAYHGVSHNDNAEVAAFTRMLDDLKKQANCPGLVLANHMGRKDHEQGQEHGAGATELDNWTDMRWIYTKDGDKQDSPRFLKVEGRGGYLDESKLTWDDDSRRLMLMPSDVGTDRSKAKAGTIEEEILQFVGDNENVTANGVTEGVAKRKADVLRVIKELVAEGRLERHPRHGGGFFFTVSDNIHIDFG